MAERTGAGLRALLLAGEYPPLQGGVGDYTAHLAKHLAAADVTVAVGSGAYLAAGDVEGNPAVWRHARRWDYAAFRYWRQQAARWGADVVNLQYQAAAYAMHPAANLACLLVRGRAARPRVVVTFHDLRVPYLFPKAGPLRRLAVMLLAATADACVVTNAEDATALRRHWLGGRTPRSVVPIGSNILCPADRHPNRAARRRRLGVGPDELLLTYFGFLNESKGIELLFDTLRELVRRGRRARLLMIGGTAGDSDPTNRPYERQIRAFASVPPLGDRVLWTGFVDGPDVSAYLLAGDACVLPFREGASFRHGTLLAAVEHGLAIVSTLPPGVAGAEVGRTDGLRPLVDGQNALLVPADNVTALVDAVERLAASPALAARLRAGAAELAGQFRWPSIAAQTVDVYRRVLARPRARR